MAVSDIGNTSAERLTIQARGWLLRRQSGQMNPVEQRAFERWYQRDGAHRQEYDRLCALWQELDLIADDVLSDYDCDMVPLSDARPQPAVSFQRLRSVAASLLLVAFLVGAYWQLSPSSTAPLSEQYSSAKRELRTIVLDDGSTLELGPYSRARIVFDEQQRLVLLGSGEAYFRVAKDAQRPFIVKTSHGQTRAVGTEFDVRLGVNQVRVTVHEGLVEVTTVGRSQRISKSHVRVGEQVSYSSIGRLSAIRDVDLTLSAAWRNGTMVFEQQPLFEVVDELNRYSRKKVIIGDPRLKAIKVNGIFQSGEIDAVLDAIEASLPAELVHSDDSITLRYKPATRS